MTWLRHQLAHEIDRERRRGDHLGLRELIATAPLSANLMGELMPRRMMCSETRKLHYYYRPSPDGERILFGGRDGTIAGDPDWPTENLRRALVDIFPVLDGARSRTAGTATSP